jgi:YgiT-type zinc finger domain-containing protein
MTGKLGKNSRCPVCGGNLKSGRTTVPFLLTGAVILVKNVPAEICTSCHEPYMTGKVTDQITNLLSPLREFQAEVLILAYPESQPVLALPAV